MKIEFGEIIVIENNLIVQYIGFDMDKIIVETIDNEELHYLDKQIIRKANKSEMKWFCENTVKPSFKPNIKQYHDK